MSSEVWRDDTDYDEEVLEALGEVVEDGPERAASDNAAVDLDP